MVQPGTLTPPLRGSGRSAMLARVALAVSMDAAKTNPDVAEGVLT
jgi:hypothetical protein